MSAFDNNVKDDVYETIMELFRNGYKVSDLFKIIQVAVEDKEREEENQK